MNSKAILISSAVASLIALGGVATHSQAQVAPDPSKEKCYGIVKAGMNDCAANGHSCAGQSKASSNAKEWIYVSIGSCERIAGGSLKPKA